MLKRLTLKRITSAAFWVVLRSLAVANGLLIRQNMQMRRALDAYRPRQLEVGAAVRPFTATALDGSPLGVSYDDAGPKKVMLYFTRTCPYCRQQFANWRRILERVDSVRFEVIGLVDEAEDRSLLEDYLRAVGCGTDSTTPLRVAFVPKDVRRDYKLTATPVTLLVSSDGKVEKNWPGAWGETEKADAALSLGLDFAGL